MSEAAKVVTDEEVVVAAKEALKETVEEVVKEEPVEQVELSPTEQQAMEQGWRPKEEWVSNGGDPDEWKPAKLFIKDGELYKSLHAQKREIRRLGEAHDALRKHHTRVFDMSYQQAIKDLRNQRRQAITEQDVDALERVEEQIEKVNTEYQTQKAAISGPTPDARVVANQQAVEAWVERNPWYNSDKELRKRADAEGFIYLNDGGDPTPEKLLSHVEREMKKQYPEKFGVKKAAPSPAVGTDRTVRAGKSADFELDDLERHIMDSLVESGEMTKAQYIAELKRAKGIK